MTARGDGYAETWMLFCSGGATRIDVDLHEPAEFRHAGKVAHVVKDCDAAMRDAAERGCRAALAWVERHTGTAPACVVSFDLPDVPAGQDVGDASGGLAFAVAAARAMHATAPGAIAAVGVIESGLRGGPLRGVEGIEAKVGGALDRLPDGGRLVYPTGNHSEISTRLREQLDERGIETTPVASVDEALDRLFAVVEAGSPAASDMAGPQRGLVPGPSGAGAEDAGAGPRFGTAPPATGSRSVTRWMIPVAVAAAAAVALWLGREGPQAPAPSAGQTAVTSETAQPTPSPDGPHPAGTESGTPTATAAVSTQDGTSPESKAAQSSFNEASRSDASDAPTDSSFEEASNDRGFD